MQKKNYETKIKNTSEEVKLKTTLYDLTYGATGANEDRGWFWKYVGVGYGFGVVWKLELVLEMELEEEEEEVVDVVGVIVIICIS